MDEFAERKAWKNKIYVYKRGMNSLIFLVIFIFTACVSTNKSGEPDKLVFDHTNVVIENTEEFFSLKKRGFTLMEKPVRHPGPVECRFIMFAPEDYPSYQYLEWCYTNSYKKLYEKSVESGDGERTRSGIAYRTFGNMDVIYADLKMDFADYGIETFHKNFNWEENGKDKLPGWDFIFTKKPVLNDVGLFGVKYGQRKKKTDLSKSIHMNSAEKIIGALLDINSEELNRMAKFSRDQMSGGLVSNPHGFHILRLQDFMGLAKKLTPKAGIYKAVVLRVGNLTTFKQMASPDYEFQYRGQKFYGIKTKAHAWDILATDSDEFVN